MSDASEADERRGATGPGNDGASSGVGTSSTARGSSRSDRLGTISQQGTPYTESQVIMSTVKFVSPFALTYGLFVTFHGGGSPGGGFQGGAIAAAVVFMIAFAFGIDATRRWLANTVVVGLAVGGALVFAAIGLVPAALGGAFLQYDRLPVPVLDPVKYGMEAVEILGIAAIVSGVLTGLFFVLASGFNREGLGATATGQRPDGGADAARGTPERGER